MLKRNRKRDLKNAVLKPLTWFKGLSSVKRIVIIVVLVAVGFLVYTQAANYLEKRKFDRIEATVVELTNRINHEFGTKTVEMQKYCRYDTIKLGNGQLRCVVSTSFSAATDKTPGIMLFTTQQDDLVKNGDIGKTSADYRLTFDNVFCNFSNKNNEQSAKLYCISEARTAKYPVIN